jgi:hypothetical protein
MKVTSKFGSHALIAAKWILFIFIVVAWATKIPYGQISEFVGCNFPWPDNRSMKWSALLVERSLIESIVCIPTAYLLSHLYRRCLHVAILLILLYIPRAALDLSSPLSFSYTTAFVFFGMVIHAVLLIGGIFAFRRQSGNKVRSSGSELHASERIAT